MKTILYIGVFLFSGFILSQEKSRDISKKTKTKTVTIDNGNEVVENKVKVTTTKNQAVKLSEEDANKVNQDRVLDTNEKITKTIAIDNDMDPFFDSQIKVVSFQQNGKDYRFVKQSKGFDVSAVKSNTKYGRAIKSSIDNYYFFNTETYSGIGYFNNNGDFIIEYYDSDTKSLITKEFISLK